MGVLQTRDGHTDSQKDANMTVTSQRRSSTTFGLGDEEAPSGCFLSSIRPPRMKERLLLPLAGLVFRTRQPFSPEQLAVLERYYEHNRYISAFHRMELAAQINLTERQVNVWFCNRRRKDKNLAQ